MQIHLKRGEKIYVNGAVVRVDRRASLEFLNDVNFLLENHVIQAEEARTPFKQLYFVVQTMMIDPENAGVTHELYKHLSHRLGAAIDTAELKEALVAADEKVKAGRLFEALKQLRAVFTLEESLLDTANPHSTVEAA
ncbi:MAG: flagellar biosynthesis repressor FlbT [Rhizobiales bacterium]|nr:flagellar biosynthesis repressor FlbT [Hyphomicrobiales bacterium]MBI3672776.1 flagellar biosynthesis repressor FlbT [Hyphomicrobiales bacterium]